MTLTPVSYLVLGELARHGAATPYDLKRWVGLSVGNFWSFPHAQLYKEPPRLAAAGLLAEEREVGGRRRRVFAITDAGRAALAAWLARPATALTELRDPGLLQLAFLDQGAPGDLRELAAARARVHREHLALYRGFAALPEDEIVWSLRRTLEVGLAWETMVAEFWERLLAETEADADAETEA